MGWSRSWLLAIALTSSCVSPRTALVIVVESDLPVPSRLASVHAEAGASEHDFALDATSLRLPFSFGVEPSDGSTEPIALRIEGRDPTGRAFITHSARVGFVAGRTLVLRVRLDAACDGVSCEQGMTCTAGGCVDDRIDALTLPVLVPGHELDRDAGPTLDGAAEDAGEHDAGPTLPRSCSELPPDSASGVYAIDPDGDSGEPAFDVYCDDGWALIAKADDRSSLLVWEHDAWEAASPEGFAFGTNDLSETDAILPAYWRMPVSALRMVVIDSDGMRELDAELGVEEPITLREAMGVDGGVAIDADLVQWARLAGVTPLTPAACVSSRVRSEAVAARVRIGVTASEDVSCMPTMMWIGIGAETDPQGGNCRATTYAAGGARLCSPRVNHETSVLVLGR